MPSPVSPGRSLVTRRAVVDLVRTATLGSYGVTGFSDPSFAARMARWLRLQPAGVRVRLTPRLEVSIWLTVAWGLPIAEVARQVDSAVRYALRRALGRDADAVLIHVNKLRVLPLAASSGVPPSDAGARR